MNNLEEFNYINNLYEIYRNLLTKKQILVMDNYYRYNLSLSEIAEEIKISRSAVLDTINHSKAKLIEFETQLKIFKKQNMIKSILEKYHVSEQLKEEIYKEL